MLSRLLLRSFLIAAGLLMHLWFSPARSYSMRMNSYSGNQAIIQALASGSPIILPSDPPDPPVLISPVDQSNNNPTGTVLSVLVSDPDNDNLKVHFIGRKKLSSENDFTIIGLPDTQYYTGEKNGGSPEIFYSQTQWITDNLESENIVFISHLGDCVEHGDDIEDEWKYADTAMKIIEDPLTTLLIDGIPYAIAVGNHDQTPWGDPMGTTNYYNQYFGESRFLGRDYYGGHYGDDNDNSFQTFEAGGMDFLVINLEYDLEADEQVLTWLDDLLITHSEKRVIIASHYVIKNGNPAKFGTQGAAIYEKVKDNENVFLMLGGHVPGEGQRSDTYNGNTIHSLLADYQMRDNGGEGWLRIMKFSPENNLISVSTYSPFLDEWETDANSQFSLSHDMSDAGYTQIGSVDDIESGSNVNMNWELLDPNTDYEWYVVVEDGQQQITSPTWLFSTGNHRLELKVFLEGPFDETTMTNDIQNSLPLSQPYNIPPWNYTGDESTGTMPDEVVDWILIDLRDAALADQAGTASSISRKAALLKTNGHVVDMDGSNLLEFNHSVTNDLFVVISHRNHLDILSANSLQNEAGIFKYDFLDNSEKYYGGSSACNLLISGEWGMVAGDINKDGVITEDDKVIWSLGAGTSGYLSEDTNLDGYPDNNDKNKLWIKNLNRSSQVPE